MEDLHVVDGLNNAGNWLIRNQALIISYAVNIVAAIAIIIIGMVIARIISNAVNRRCAPVISTRPWQTSSPR